MLQMQKNKCNVKGGASSSIYIGDLPSPTYAVADKILSLFSVGTNVSQYSYSLKRVAWT
jgi:hypothetical protein